MRETTRIKRLFRDAIRRGTGRAHLLMRAHPGVDFSDDILKAARTNYAYDPQCEQSRGAYVLELVQLLEPRSRREKTIGQILTALVSTREASWGLTQLFDIAGRLAEEGNAAARAAFYQRFALGCTSSEFDYDGEYALVELDEVAGLLHVAEARGQMLADDTESWEDDHLLEFTQERNPDVAVETELEKAAVPNEHIARYLRAVREYQKPDRRPPRQPISALEAVQRFLAVPETRFLPRHTIRRLTSRQVRQLAADFEQETSRKRQVRYLDIFRLVKCPIGFELLLQLAETTLPSRYSSVLDDAVEALSFFRAPAVREFALAKLIDSPAAWRYAHLFINNYQTGDDLLLLRLVEQTTGEGPIESLAISLYAIYQKNRTRKCQGPLRALYQRMNCGLHRANVVELLLKRGVLPADIQEEIPFDSYEGVRELAAEQPA